MSLSNKMKLRSGFAYYIYETEQVVLSAYVINYNGRIYYRYEVY